MTRSDPSVFDPYLSADLVLRQAEIGVIVVDREGCVQFVNSCAARILRLAADSRHARRAAPGFPSASSPTPTSPRQTT